MCMIDGCDTWVWFRSAQRTARKSHTCTECRRPIAAGEIYEYATGKLDEGVRQFRTCVQCQAVREWLLKVCSGWVYEAVHEEMIEHFREGYGVWLGRAAVGMARKWRRFDGEGLMPPLVLPSVLPTGEVHHD